MPSGSKKNQSARSSGKEKDGYHNAKQFKPAEKQEAINPPGSTSATPDDSNLSKKFSRRKIESNWAKYDEPKVDPHVDVPRGQNFEVLLSYSGGTDSQLQLHDEKDWEDDKEKVVTLDLADLSHVMKCIPLYERFNLPRDIFTESQLENMEKDAVFHQESYVPKMKPNFIIEDELNNLKIDENTTNKDVFHLEPDEIQFGDMKEVENSDFVELGEETTNVIDSITSLLTTKSDCKVKAEFSVKPEDKDSNLPSDLHFLLSVNAPIRKFGEASGSKDKKTTDIDDWLNSVLDE